MRFLKKNTMARGVFQLFFGAKLQESRKSRIVLRCLLITLEAMDTQCIEIVMIIVTITMTTETVIEIGLESTADRGQEAETGVIIIDIKITAITTTIAIEIMRRAGTVRFVDMDQIVTISK